MRITPGCSTLGIVSSCRCLSVASSWRWARGSPYRASSMRRARAKSQSEWRGTWRACFSRRARHSTACERSAYAAPVHASIQDGVIRVRTIRRLELDRRVLERIAAREEELDVLEHDVRGHVGVDPRVQRD